MASLEMFKSGLFSGDPDQPFQADGPGLKRLSFEQLKKGLQVSESNPLAGLEGRAGLLSRLGDALMAEPKFFGRTARPGNMLGRT